jgi:hypothetical protein
MSVTAEFLDCPHCHSAGAVSSGACQVCDAGVVPLRFADVIDELRVIASLAAGDDTMAARGVAHAAARAESLLAALRDQFMVDIVGSQRRP